MCPLPTSGEARAYVTTIHNKADIFLATKGIRPIMLIYGLAHEYKHCLQRFVEGKDLRIPKGEYWNAAIEHEAARFGKTEAYAWRDKCQEKKTLKAI
jgi:hypothetical protein